MGSPLIGAFATLGSSLVGGLSAYEGSQAIAGALKKATAQQGAEYNTGIGLLQPSITAGNTARGYELGALGLPGGVDASTATAAFRNSPGYQFALKQGENAVQTSAAAGGQLFSGKTLKDLNTYAQGTADQNFNSWLGNVGGVANGGNTATGTAVNLGQSTATNLSQLALGAGQNQASAYATGSGAINTGIKSLMDLYNQYNPPTASASSYPASGSVDAYGYGMPRG